MYLLFLRNAERNVSINFGVSVTNYIKPPVVRWRPEIFVFVFNEIYVRLSAMRILGFMCFS